MACVLSPTGRRGLPKDVLYIGAGAVLKEQADNFDVAARSGLMEWGGMRMATDRIIAIGVFAGVEQQTDNFKMTEVGGEAQG